MKPDKFTDGTEQQSDPLISSGVLSDVQLLWQEFYALGYHRLRLAALETQRAGQSLVVMLIAGILVACLLGSAWLGLVATAVLLLIEHGWVVTSALLLAVAAHLLAALVLLVLIRRKSRYLKLPATLHSLQPKTVEQQKVQKK
ncbi:MAG: phage holin family protein [Methylococcales bacterium]